MGEAFVNSVDEGYDCNKNVTDYWTVTKEDCFANFQFKCTTCCSEDSTSSIGSESSSDLLDDDEDASSSSACSSTESRDRTAAQILMKKGLSKYYHGKARTFTSLSDVKCVEDLAKKEIPFVRRCHRKTCHSPEAIISKKNTRGSATSLVSSEILTRHRSI